MRIFFAAISTVLIVVVIVLAVVVVGASALFLIPSHNQTSTTITSSVSSTLNSSTGEAARNFMEFAFPGTLIASPDLAEINYSVSLSGVQGNLILKAIAPQGLNASFSPDNVTLGSTTLQVGASESISPGLYQIILEAAGNGYVNNETVMVQVIKYLVVTVGTSFVPSNLTVTTGANVTWVRLNGPLSTYDDGTHDVAFLTGASAVSPALAQYGSWSYTFSQSGEYNYYCKYHPLMMGEIMVTS